MEQHRITSYTRKGKYSAERKPRSKQLNKMTFEELEIKLQETKERHKVLDAKLVKNGGIGLLATQAQENINCKSLLKRIAARMEELKNG